MFCLCFSLSQRDFLRGLFAVPAVVNAFSPD